MSAQTQEIAERIHAISSVDAGIVVEGLSRAESGFWPYELFDRALTAVDSLPDVENIGFHHIGYLLPNRELFEASTGRVTAPVIHNTLIDPAGHTHHRKYIRVPHKSAGNDTFVEFALLGEGDGRSGIHFDFIHPDAENMLRLIKKRVDTPDFNIRSLFSTVNVSYGGGNAPVGKVGLRPLSNPDIEVGVMFRTHWSDPAYWG